MTTTTYLGDQGNNYAAQKGVKLKLERNDDAPVHPEQLFAMGPNDPDWFLCQLDSFGNICDTNGVVVYPSKSGAHPLEAGERGYFGDFAENYTSDGENPSASALPRVKQAISLKAARKALGLTQKQLADATGVNVRQIQRVELGEAQAGNLTAKNLLALADALGVDPRNLI